MGQAYLGVKSAVPLSQESRSLVGKGASPRAGPRSLVQAGRFGVVLTEPLHTTHPRPCCFQEETAVFWDRLVLPGEHSQDQLSLKERILT